MIAISVKKKVTDKVFIMTDVVQTDKECIQRLLELAEYYDVVSFISVEEKELQTRTWSYDRSVDAADRVSSDSGLWI